MARTDDACQNRLADCRHGGRIPRPRQAGQPTEQLLQLRLSYPRPGSAVLYLRGEVDRSNIERLTELVQPRLRSGLDELTLDLSGLTFLALDGALALARLARVARWRNICLRITELPRPVRRALRATGVEQQLLAHRV